jgi:hypothetical protein
MGTCKSHHIQGPRECSLVCDADTAAVDLIRYLLVNFAAVRRSV